MKRMFGTLKGIVMLGVCLSIVVLGIFGVPYWLPQSHLTCGQDFWE